MMTNHPHYSAGSYYPFGGYDVILLRDYVHGTPISPEDLVLSRRGRIHHPAARPDHDTLTYMAISLSNGSFTAINEEHEDYASYCQPITQLFIQEFERTQHSKRAAITRNRPL